MTYKEACYMYLGYPAKYASTLGTICGYGKWGIIMAVDSPTRYGWNRIGKEGDIDEMITHGDPINKYYWVKEEHILKGSNPLANKSSLITSDEAEKYIKSTFPNATDEEVDLYMNIFLEGTKYIKS